MSLKLPPALLRAFLSDRFMTTEERARALELATRHTRGPHFYAGWMAERAHGSERAALRNLDQRVTRLEDRIADLRRSYSAVKEESR